MKKIPAIIIAMIFLITGCSNKTTPNNYSSSNNSSTVISFGTETTWEKIMPSSILKPKTANLFVADGDLLYCYGIDDKAFADYMETLKSNGYRQIGPQDSIDYSFIKDNILLSITKQTFSGNGGNHIRLSYKIIRTDTDLIIGEINSEQAKEKIIKYLKTITDKNDFLYGKEAGEIIQINIKDAWEKMNLQAFQAYGIGCFLIKGNDIGYSFDYLDDACVVDIDNDKEYELVNIFGWGSGIFRYDLTAFKGTTFFAHSVWIPNSGYSELTIQKINDNTVILRGFEYSDTKRVLKEDYGKIITQKSGNEYKLMPENINEFPFKEMTN